MVKKSGKKEIKEVRCPKTFSALNLAVIFMAAAFIIGTYSSLDIATIRISNSCGFFCRMNNVMTGNVVETPGLGISGTTAAISTCTKTDAIVGTLTATGLSCDNSCDWTLQQCSLVCDDDGRTLRLIHQINCQGYCWKDLKDQCHPGCGNFYMRQDISHTKDCGTNTAETRICSGNDVNVTYYTKGCSNSACHSNFINQKVETCSYKCSDGACVQPGTCASQGGTFKDISEYSCLNKITGVSGIIAASDSSGNTQCCDLTTSQWYEEYDSITETCPKDTAGRAQNMTATNGKTYCLPGKKQSRTGLSTFDTTKNEICYPSTATAGTTSCDTSIGKVYEKVTATETCPAGKNITSGTDKYCEKGLKTAKVGCAAFDKTIYDKTLQSCTSPIIEAAYIQGLGVNEGCCNGAPTNKSCWDLKGTICVTWMQTCFGGAPSIFYPIYDENLGTDLICCKNYCVDKVKTGGTCAEIGVDRCNIAPTTIQASTYDGLVGYWQLENNAADSSGNGLDGTPTGGAWTDGKAGRGYLSNNFLYSQISVANNLILSPLATTGKMTIEAWIKLNDFQEASQGIVSKTNEYGILINNGTVDKGNLTLVIEDNTGAAYTFLTTSGLIDLNNWHHVAIVVDKNVRASIYVDGIKVAEDTVFPTGMIFSNNDNLFYMGLIDGTIDEAAIWNRTLSDSEISTHAAGGHYAATGTKTITTAGESCPGMSWITAADDTETVKCCSEICKPADADTKVPAYGTCEEEAGAVSDRCNYDEMCPNFNWKWAVEEMDIPQFNETGDFIGWGTGEYNPKCCAGQCQKKALQTCGQQGGEQCSSSQTCYQGQLIPASDDVAGSKLCCSGICVAKVSEKCGNGVIDLFLGEECEAGIALGKTCPSLGFASGMLKCTNCRYDTSECRTSTGETGGAVGVCMVGNVQVGEGYRTSTQYCDPLTRTMQTQKVVDSSCGMHYECTSYLCSSGKCTEVREVLALIPRIWCWLKSWITYPADTEARQTAICSCEEDYGRASETFC
jgi:hypothetical protein